MSQDIAPFDIAPTVISQYANSVSIQALLNDFSAWLDPAADLNALYDYVWNIDSAQGFGLEIWGRIVGLDGRVFPISDVKYFGFDEATDAQGFNQGVFWSGTVTTTNYALSDTAFRRLILAKALSNIIDGSTPSINRLLMNLFAGRGNAYVIDNANMTMTYHFAFAFDPVDQTIVMNSGVLPVPNGVSVNIVHL